MKRHYSPIAAVLLTIPLLVTGCSRGAQESIDSSATDGSASGSPGSGLGGGISSAELGGLQGTGSAIPGSQEDLEVNVGDRVFFAFDSATLDMLATETLDRQAVWLQQNPGVTVTIEGHTDEQGTRDYNLALGERRATAAKEYLVTSGVESVRLLIVSYGEERPVDPAHDDTAYALNRRAVTVVDVVN